MSFDEESLLAHVQPVWVPLWTDRVVTFRAALGVDQRAVEFAVVVQKIVDARVSGVPFTANPLTGNRHEAIVDASPGLGEAVVSGAVWPDLIVVQKHAGDIIERKLGESEAAAGVDAPDGTPQVEMNQT